MYVVAVVVAGLDYLGIGFVYCGFLGKLVVQVAQSAVERTVEEPAYQAESKDVAAFEHGLGIKSRAIESGFGHRCDRHLYHLSLDAELLEGTVGSEESLLEVSLFERIDVDDDYTPGLEELHILLQGGRIHGNKHITAVAGGMDVLAYTYLEA